MTQECDNSRMQMAYNYLYNNGKVHSVSDLAIKMGRSRTSVSKALNGEKNYLTDKFLIAFTRTFVDISLDWLLTGEGEMLITNYADESQGATQIDQSSLVNATIAAKDETIASKDQTIESLQRQISKLEKENDELKAQVEHLKAISYDSDLRDFPFDMGVSEVKPKKQPRV